MALGSVLVLKEQPQTYQPLLLCEFTFRDGTIYRASTHALSALYGGSAGFEFGGNEWEPRIVSQQIGATQAMSDIGVDVPPNAQIILADPDITLRNTLEIPKGFKGAILKIYSVMFDAGNTLTASFSADSPSIIKFIGTCSAPEWDQGNLVVSARSLLNISQTMMPPFRIQQLCGNTFPTNAVDRLAGGFDPSSLFYRCGYAPDQGGPGNYESGSAAFTTCDYTRSACRARLGNTAAVTSQLDKDQLGRDSGRFGGFTYVPNSSSGLQRSYTTGNWTEIINASTTAKYGDFEPICYGTTWVIPKIMGTFGDGNYTSWEVLVNMGAVDRIHKVLVNGFEIPYLAGDYARPIDADSATPTFVNGFWVGINNGNRNGISNPLAGWGNMGDPYGSMTAIHVQVLNEVASANTLPEIQVLLDGSHVRQFNGLDSWTTGFSRNPAWVLMDLLTLCGWRYEDMDVGSWINAARICDETMYFNSMSGFYQNFYSETGSPPYRRYSTGFSIMSRTAISEVIRGLRNNMRGILYFDYYTGKLTLASKQTIAAQQPSPILGSNYNTPVDSATADGVPAQGYVAYHFNGDNIIKDKDGGRSSLSVSQMQNNEAPNKISEVFQNRENTYNQDACVVVDTEDASRMGGYPISGTFPLLGAQTFDHVRRVTFGYMAECNRGNTRTSYLGSAIGDTGGTMAFTFKTTIKGVHLVVGHICLLTDETTRGTIFKLPVRVIRIKPETNFETAEIVAVTHNDNWYLDTFGQVNAPTYGNLTGGSSRPPFAWEAGMLQPNPADIYYGQDVTVPDVIPTYVQTVGDQPFAYLSIRGVPPVNVFDPTLQRPRISSPGSMTSGSPSWPSDYYYMGIAQYRSSPSGAITTSPLSQVAGIPSGSPGKLEVPVASWPPGPGSGHVACVGRDPSDLYWADNIRSRNTSAVLTNISATSFLNDLHCPPPDEVFTNFRWQVQEELWPGIFRARISSIDYALDGSGNTTLGVSLTGTVDSNAWVGRALSFVGINPDNISASLATSVLPRIPVANLEVLSNDADGTTVVAGNPLNNGYPFNVGDMVTMRFAPTFGTDDIGPYFEDALVVSPYHASGFGANTLSGAQALIIAGTGKGTSVTIMMNTTTRCYVQGWPVAPDSTSRVVVLDPTLRVDQKSLPVRNAILNLQDVTTVPSYLVNVTSLQHKMLFLRALTEGADGQLSPAVISPFRELYVFDGSVDGLLVNGQGGPGNLG